MRPARYVVTSGNTPLVIQVDYRSEWVGVIASPSGAGDYDVAFARSPVHDTTITPTWIDFTNMTAATTDIAASENAITAIRITLNSGTDVSVDIAESLAA